MQNGFNSIILPNTQHPTPNTQPIDPDKFRKMVAERAYSKAEKRGFIAGHETEDWLEAEVEIKNQCLHWFQ